MCYGWKFHTFLKTSLVGTGALLFYKDPQPIDQLKNEKKKDQSKPMITFSWLFLD